MQLLGVYGHPIGHSLSPTMHQAGLKKAGLVSSYFYLPFDILPEQLPAAVAAIRALGMRGVNVTIPYKEKVLPLLDEVTAEAAQLGAVNVIVNEHGRLIGHNTDGIGFLRSMNEESGVSPAGKKVLLIGAGGACRAVAATLLKAGAAELVLVNRSRERAAAVAAMADPDGARTRVLDMDDPSLGQAVTDADILINTTSLGMTPDTSCPLPEQLHHLHTGQLVCDIVYRPERTPWLLAAEGHGCRTLGGLGMLLYQGAEAFRLWTGAEAPVTAMRAALYQLLRQLG